MECGCYNEVHALTQQAWYVLLLQLAAEMQSEKKLHGSSSDVVLPATPGLLPT